MQADSCRFVDDFFAHFFEMNIRLDPFMDSRTQNLFTTEASARMVKVCFHSAC